MGIEALIIFIIVGAIAGWLAGLIVRGAGFGLIGDIIVGIVGAFIAAGCWDISGLSSPAAFSAQLSTLSSAP